MCGGGPVQWRSLDTTGNKRIGIMLFLSRNCNSALPPVISAIGQVAEGVVSIPRVGIDTNMVMFDMLQPELTAAAFSERLLQV